MSASAIEETEETEYRRRVAAGWQIQDRELTPPKQLRLQAQRHANGWAVDRDDESADSWWWPDEAAAEEIETSADPAAAALAICRHSPERGSWV